MPDTDTEDRSAGDARRVVLKKEREAGVCVFGHDLTLPGAMIVSKRTHQCVACGPHAPGMCRSGRHPKVPGAPRCAACRKERQKLPFRSSGPPKLGNLPPAEVLAGASCSLETAHLFEQKDVNEGHPAFNERSAKARAICDGCPVRELCLADAYKHRRLGTYGGHTLSLKHHTPMARAS